MIFVKVQRLYGEVNLLTDPPPIEIHRDVTLVDRTLYDRSRQMIPDSGLFRGVPSYTSLGGPVVTNYDGRRIRDCMPDHNFFWLGQCHLHFGHFLISTLSRAWALTTLPPDMPIAYCGGVPPKQLFTIDFVRECFTALGITEQRLVQVAAPIHFPLVTVAARSFTENHSIYPAHFRMLRSIASALCDNRTPDLGESFTPVYVSKEKVTHGVRSIANESALTSELQKYNIEVAFPETLTFRQQLAFWSQKRLFLGFSNSAFHMSAFFGGKQLCTITHDGNAWTNQVLLDMASGNESLHIFPVGGLKSLGKTGKFSDTIEIKAPALMAQDLARLAASFGSARTIRPQRLAPEPRTLCPTVNVNDPFGANLARHGRATQSSTYSIDEGQHRTADGAINGQLTGRYQCHTEREHQPWWQVELPELSAINEVRVFNRCDHPVAQPRLNHLRILLSTDGHTWSLAAERRENEPIGGLRGQPYRWLAPPRTTARFVRLQIPQMEYLHLDQVEVFGEPAEAIWME